MDSITSWEQGVGTNLVGVYIINDSGFWGKEREKKKERKKEKKGKKIRRKITSKYLRLGPIYSTTATHQSHSPSISEATHLKLLSAVSLRSSIPNDAARYPTLVYLSRESMPAREE